VKCSVPRISTGRSVDATKLRSCGDVVCVIIDRVTKQEVDRSWTSAVPRFYKVVPTNYGKDDIAGDNDLVAIPNVSVVRPLLVAK
jgi:hypothetical protein